MNSRISLLLAAVCLLFVSPAFALHPYHVSLTEIEWNSKTGSFEVAVCLWPADLEKALTIQEKKLVDLDKPEGLDDQMASYVSKNFVCSNGDNIAELRWVGFESDNKQTWIYFELKPDKDAKVSGSEWKLENRLFFDLNDDQLNHINFVSGSQKTSFVSSADSDKINLNTGD